MFGIAAPGETKNDQRPDVPKDPITQEVHMGAKDKIANEAREAKGKIKEGVGAATDDTRLEYEGKAEQVEAEGRKTVEEARDRLT